MSSVLNCTGHEIRIPNIVDGEGQYVFDDQGNRYLDLESGVWCLPLGHKNSRVNTALLGQAQTITHAGFCYANDVVEEAASAVLAITGLTNGKCVFLASGSETIELGRQICRHITKKSTSLCLHDSYFGSYSATMDREEGWYEFDWRKFAAGSPETDDLSDCPEIEAIPDDISEFDFEPGSASGFVRFPPTSLIRGMVEKVRQGGGKILVNEVTTGIGRTGRWFGYNHYGIQPDLVCMGKGLGNGYPVSALAISEETARELEGTGFKYMQSHQNDPMGAAVAKEVIATLTDEDLISRAADLGERFLPALQTLTESEHVTEVRGRGLIYAVEFREKAVGDKVYSELLDRGYIICNRGGTYRIDPPLIVNESDFMAFVETFRGILAAQ